VTGSRTRKNTTGGRSTATDSHDRILHSLRRIARALDISSHKLAAKKGVTSVQLLCLSTLAAGAADTATAVAQLMHLSPSAVVGILDRLQAKGLVERKRDAEDRRVVRVVLTRKGRSIVGKTQHPIQNLLESRGKNLSKAETKQIADTLDRLVEVLGAEDIDGETPYGKLPPGSVTEGGKP